MTKTKSPKKSTYTVTATGWTPEGESFPETARQVCNLYSWGRNRRLTIGELREAVFYTNKRQCESDNPGQKAVKRRITITVEAA